MSDIVTASLYGGTTTVEFNPGAHRYKVVGVDAIPDGVTTICSAIVPKFLEDWAARVAVGAVREKVLANLETKYTDRRDMIAAFEKHCSEAESTHKLLRDAGGDRGSRAHDYIERTLTGLPVFLPTDPLVANTLEAFHAWKEEWPFDIRDCERIIYSKDLFYCGKCDVFGYTMDGKPAVVDFKTGSGFYDDHPYQLTGYAVALEEELDILIEDGYIVHLDKKTGKYKVYHVRIDDGMKDAWALGVRHYKHLKKVRQMVKEIKHGMAESGR